VNITQSFKIAVKSLVGKKGRSFLTMLGIIIGVAAVVIMVSIVQGSNKMMEDIYKAMGTNIVNVNAMQWNGKDITNDLYNYCLGMNDLVLGVSPAETYYPQSGVKYKTTSTQNMENGSPQIYLGSDQFSICNNFTLAEGRDIAYIDVKKYNKVIVLGSALADYLFPYRSPIGEKVSIDGNTFTVIGVYASKMGNDSQFSEMLSYYDNMAVVPYTLNRLLNKTTSMSSFAVKAASKEATNKVITLLDGFLSTKIDSNRGYYYVYSQNQWQEQDQNTTKTLSLVVGGIAGISLLVGGIGIMNIMLVTVTERTREIGIRMAIGASRSSIIVQFLIEAAVICALGGIFGLMLGFLGTVVGGKLILDMLLMPSVSMTIGAVSFSVVLGLVFGMYPAIKASGLQPVEALRGE
jgi:putative ABC transport system permease protein